MFVDDGTAGTNPQGNPMSAEDVTHLLMTFLVKLLLFTENMSVWNKILNAENAGAVAAIIINREPGLVNMAPGDDGANVTYLLFSSKMQLVRSLLMKWPMVL